MHRKYKYKSWWNFQVSTAINLLIMYLQQKNKMYRYCQKRVLLKYSRCPFFCFVSSPPWSTIEINLIRNHPLNLNNEYWSIFTPSKGDDRHKNNTLLWNQYIHHSAQNLLLYQLNLSAIYTSRYYIIKLLFSV